MYLVHDQNINNDKMIILHFWFKITDTPENLNLVKRMNLHSDHSYLKIISENKLIVIIMLVLLIITIMITPVTRKI